MATDSSDSDVTAPGTTVSALAQGAPGEYDLGFFVSGPGGFTPVTSLPVLSNELILGAHVANATGTPATRGAVTFQYCSFKGLPPGDITRPDEAPSAACDNGTATWRNLGSIKVNASGDAFLDFGIVQIPRTVGFRLRYSSEGSGIAGAVTPPADFTWVPAV